MISTWQPQPESGPAHWGQLLIKFACPHLQQRHKTSSGVASRLDTKYKTFESVSKLKVHQVLGFFETGEPQELNASTHLLRSCRIRMSEMQVRT